MDAISDESINRQIKVKEMILNEKDDNEKIPQNRHISLLLSQKEVLNYTNMLKDCVNEFSEATIVIPKISD